jgi:hypothetical protein
MGADVTLEVFYDGTWHDLVAGDQVMAGQAITVTRGDNTAGQAPRPARLTAQLDNTDDDLRPSNPESVLYETAGIGLPVRVTRGGVVRGHVQASEWAVDETNDFRRHPKRGRAWVDLQGAGLLEQVVSSPRLDSPIIRDVLARAGLVGFWPCEEESQATGLSNLAPGGKPGRVHGEVTYGDSSRPPGAARTVKVSAGSSMNGRMLPNQTTGWTAVFAVKIAATRTSTYREVFRWIDSLTRNWVWEANDAGFRVSVYEADGGLSDQETISVTYASDDFMRCSLSVSYAAGTVSWEAFAHTGGVGGSVGTSSTFSSFTASAPRSWSRADNAYTADACYCSIFALSDGQTSEDPVAEVAFDGHDGEPAGWRFARLLTELGFAWSWVGDPDDSIAMGPQQADTPAEILREIRDTEDGLIFDHRELLEVVMMTRVARYNQTPITVQVTELGARPREVTTTDIANVVTAAQRDGAEAVVADTTGPLGITAKGALERTIDVNLSQQRLLPDLANWWLRRWTVNEPRYPTVTVNLAALAPTRALELADVDVGQVVEIVGYRPDPIRLHVLAISEPVGWPNAWSVTWTCEPDRLFEVAEYGTARHDSSSTTLAAAAEVGATSLSLTTVHYADRWSQTATPYDLNIAGQRFTVTTMGAVSGAGPYTQPATVVPSRNGVRKRLDAGSAVHLADPPRYALKGGAMPSGDIIYAEDFDRPKVRLIQQSAGTQTIATTDTTLTFGSGSEDFDTHSWHDESTNNSRVTVDRDGYVQITGSVVVANNTTVTVLMLSVYKNGAVQLGIARGKPSANNLSHEAGRTWIFECTAGDYFELVATTAGASVSTISSGRFASTFEVTYLGPT